ncbi:MAG: hypothetical protein IIC71_13280 [Acidobacteria bacterium]|nr:hypothetical protein [Acidobacteriota bacterium]
MVYLPVTQNFVGELVGVTMTAMIPTAVMVTVIALIIGCRVRRLVACLINDTRRVGDGVSGERGGHGGCRQGNHEDYRPKGDDAFHGVLVLFVREVVFPACHEGRRRAQKFDGLSAVGENSRAETRRS